jgi:2-amino-4-hydroxy-6-hydroxymethyldihydropteridine diphosphokinase
MLRRRYNGCMATALIALGSNLGDRQRNLENAVAQLGRQPNVVVLATSRWRETRPIGGPSDQAQFLNGAALLGTSLTPQQLHAVLQQIETAAGRTRESRWAPRTLDLDLLLYDDLVLDTPQLTIPHPRMSFRRFVLEPAAEIAPNTRHPTIDWTLSQLHRYLDRRSPRYVVAIAGPFAAGKTMLANGIAETVRGRVILRPAKLDQMINSRLDAAGLQFKLQLESMRSQAELVRRTKFLFSTFMAISDFWLDQALSLAEVSLQADLFVDFVEQFRRAALLRATPQLLVLLDVPADVSWQRIAERGAPTPPRIDWLARYREVLLKRVAEPGHGPVLRLDGTKLDEAKDELIAAIQAMQ